MNDNVDRKREAIVKIIENYKSFIGMLLAAAFSMLIFLLSLIELRTILLDVGLLFLLLSIFIFFEIYIQFTDAIGVIIGGAAKTSEDEQKSPENNEKDSEDEKRALSKEKHFKVGVHLYYLGYYFFITAILYLVSHFKMVFLFLVCAAFLIFLLIKWIISFGRYLKRVKLDKERKPIVKIIDFIILIVFILGLSGFTIFSFIWIPINWSGIDIF